jgi:hypothetical protein
MRHLKAGGSDGVGQQWGVDLLGGAIIYNSWNNMKVPEYCLQCHIAKNGTRKKKLRSSTYLLLLAAQTQQKASYAYK